MRQGIGSLTYFYIAQSFGVGDLDCKAVLFFWRR